MLSSISRWYGQKTVSYKNMRKTGQTSGGPYSPFNMASTIKSNTKTWQQHLLILTFFLENLSIGTFRNITFNRLGWSLRPVCFAANASIRGARSPGALIWSSNSRLSFENTQYQNRYINSVCCDANWTQFFEVEEQVVRKISRNQNRDEGQVQLYNRSFGIPSVT